MDPEIPPPPSPRRPDMRILVLGPIAIGLLVFLTRLGSSWLERRMPGSWIPWFVTWIPFFLLVGGWYVLILRHRRKTRGPDNRTS